MNNQVQLSVGIILGIFLAAQVIAKIWEWISP